MSVNIKHYTAIDSSDDGIQYFQVWVQPATELRNVMFRIFVKVGEGGMDSGDIVAEKIIMAKERFAVFEKMFYFKHSKLPFIRALAYMKADGVEECMVERTLAATR